MANFFKKLFGKKEDIPEKNETVTPKAEENISVPDTSEEPIVETNENAEAPEEPAVHSFDKEEIKEAIEEDGDPDVIVSSEETEHFISTEEIKGLVENDPSVNIPAKEDKHFINTESIKEFVEDDSAIRDGVEEVVLEQEGELFDEIKNVFEEKDVETVIPKDNNDPVPEEEATALGENNEIPADENLQPENNEPVWVENDSPAEEQKERPHEYLDVGDGFRQAMKEAESVIFGEDNKFAAEYCGENERNLFEMIMRVLVLSPDHKKTLQRDAAHDFIEKCEEICNDIHAYDNLAYNDPAIECWDKFSAIESEEERKCVAMNLLTSLKWFRNKSLRDELKKNLKRHEEMLNHEHEKENTEQPEQE